MTTFRDILAHRGRVVVFTPNSVVGLAFEQMAERHHAQVVCTRGWADSYGPLLAWNRIYAAREYGVLSCDQHRYVHGFHLHATDLVWVGPTGDILHVSHIWRRYQHAMLRAGDDPMIRKWALGEKDL